MRLLPQRLIIEQRAKTIQDPIERLRFLRNNAASDLLPLDEQARQTPAPPLPPATESIWTWPSYRSLLVAGGVVAAAILIASTFSAVRSHANTANPSAPSSVIKDVKDQASLHSGAENSIWLVEQTKETEVYSNGLRIETRFEVPNFPRNTYAVYPRGEANAKHALRMDEPAGIIYHTTESLLAPFQPDQNRMLKRISSEVLKFVQHNHSYHFFIDRFGRIYRVVKESDVAFHAGNSVWGDSGRVFVNLNTSFLGVAFETQTEPGQNQPTATSAQINSARVLTEMLRDRYHILAENCVTHAQVSVNPGKMLIGYHTDWAGKFPFLELGLRDNYAQPPASITAFGFDYDPAFVASTGSRLTPGLLAADAELREHAAKLKCSVPQLKAMLQNNYREIAAAVRSGESAKETASEK